MFAFLCLRFLYTFGFETKLRFLFKSWNVSLLNAFLLKLGTFHIGSDWNLILLAIVLHSLLLIFSWFLLCSLSHLFLFPFFMPSTIVRGHFLVFWMLFWYAWCGLMITVFFVTWIAYEALHFLFYN